MIERFLEDQQQVENLESKIESENNQNNIEQKEGEIFSRFGKKLVELGRQFKEKPKKLSKAVALMLLLRASTAFAEANMERPQMKDTSSLQGIGETLDASPQFDWKEFIKNVEISYGMENAKEEKFKPEVIKYSSSITTYGDERDENNDPLQGKNFFDESVKNSNSIKEFFNSISKNKLSDGAKLYFLQRMGKILGGTYNYDMSRENDYVKVSDEEMFQEMKKEYNGEERQSGICGNIHTFMAKAARNIGIEAWTQSGTGHIFMGAVAELEDNKQIIFCNYDDLIPTKTLNFQKALGIAERYRKNISLFQSTVSNPDEMGMFVKSLATEKMEEATGIVDAEERFNDLMDESNNESNEDLKIKLTNETKKVEFSKDTIGLSFYDYRNMGNPYNSLESLQGVKLCFQEEDRGQNFEANVSVLHFNINDLSDRKISETEVVGEVFGSYLKDMKLNKGEYERLKLKLGITLNSIIGYSIKSEKFDVKAECGAGAQLVYVDPSETGKFWIGAEVAGRYHENNMQEQDLALQNTLTKFKLGGEVEAREGIIANLEASCGKTPWGGKTEIKVGVETDKLKFKAGAEQQDSKQERFFPDKERIEGSIGYNTPIGEIDIYGALEKEQYKDVEEEKHWEAGLKYRIVLWQ